MTKYQEIKALSDYASKQITENGQEWQKFLNCANKFTWYPFKDQILIYAQRRMPQPVHRSNYGMSG